MGGAQFKVFAAVFALVVLLGTAGGAFYAWEKIFKPDLTKTKEIRAELASKAPKTDPGKPVYFEGIELIKTGDFPRAREKLNQLIRIYADSPLAGDARRILGEMNVDRLFSKEPGPGKLEFAVSREPGLEAIAKKTQTTIPFLRKVNGLGRAVIHPGDRLVVQPLDFEVEVNLTTKRMLVRQKGEFFKQYEILNVNLSDAVPKATFIETKQGSLNDKNVRDSDMRWSQARKWLQTKSRPGKAGVIFSTQPKKASDSAQFGIHLSPADIDELCTILRAGTPLTFHKA